MHSTLEPVTMVSELNLKQHTQSLWWSSLFTTEPSFTFHTLQEGKCIWNFPQPEVAFLTSPVPGRTACLDHVKLNSVTVVTHRPPIVTPLSTTPILLTATPSTASNSRNGNTTCYHQGSTGTLIFKPPNCTHFTESGTVVSQLKIMYGWLLF